jgi:hypothetical protein
MNALLRNILLFFFSLQVLNSYAQEPTTVKCTVHGFKGKKAYLASIKGSRKIKVDSAAVLNGSFTFIRNKALPLGMYRIILNDSTFTDIILNHESVALTCDINDLMGSMVIITSAENIVFYNYLQFTRNNDFLTEPLLEKGKTLYKQGIAKNKKQLDSLKIRIDSLNKVQAAFTLDLFNANQEKFAAKVIKTLQVPSYAYYKAHTDTNRYKNENGFLRDHFFDNIDFNDTTLLFTEYIYQACSEYITGYAKPASNEAYMKASDFILAKAKVNKTMYDYVLNLLVQTFESSDWEQVFVYLTEKYYLESTCESDPNAKTLAQKAAALKKLAIGNAAPPLALKDVNDKIIDLYKIARPYVLMIFWASSCPHCEEELPILAPMIQQYIGSGKLAV